MNTEETDAAVEYLDDPDWRWPSILDYVKCVKCKKKNVEMKDEKEVIIKGKGGVKRRAATGTCPTCGAKMFRIGG